MADETPITAPTFIRIPASTSYSTDGGKTWFPIAPDAPHPDTLRLRKLEAWLLASGRRMATKGNGEDVAMLWDSGLISRPTLADAIDALPEVDNG